MMRILRTPKLFYRTFPFKAVLFFPRLTKHLSLSSSEFLSLRQFLDEFPAIEKKTRIEGRCVSIFFKDKALLSMLTEKYGSAIEEFYEPEEGALDFFLSNQSVEVRKTLIHDCRYRVILKSLGKKTKGLDGFVNLVGNHPSEFAIGDKLKDYLTGNRAWYFGAPYFYVKDSKYLMLTHLTLSSSIKEVIKIVTADEIKEKENENA